MEQSQQNQDQQSNQNQQQTGGSATQAESQGNQQNQQATTQRTNNEALDALLRQYMQPPQPQPAASAYDYNTATRQAPAPEPSYLEDPAGYIKHQLQQQTAPLLELANDIKRDKDYDALKYQYRTNPQLSGLFTQLEPYLDQKIKSLPRNIPITDALVRDTFFALLGTIAAAQAVNGGGNQQQQQQFNQQNTNQNQQQYNQQQPNQQQNSYAPQPITPPHVAPRNPAPSGNRVNIEITEAEKAIARERGLTDEEFVEIRDAGPGEFMSVLNNIRARKAAANQGANNG